MKERRSPAAGGAGSSGSSGGADDWPFRGPSAAVELLANIRASGEDVSAHREHWVRWSGIAKESAVAHHHASLVSVLHRLACFDQVGAFQLAGVEVLARRTLFLERGVHRNPMAPDFRGPEVMLASRLDAGAPLATGDFVKFIA